ncbi:endo-1,4-beta-xylanase xylA, putative (macronuclear) [Tetrahymena thermophila SB210]|uniref:Endo-1,4-beta-xylanase xylA, putative n=1 Tax=Tetrahymena thermophila (strain SB210) TaxID=312017 RepID=Q24DR9_TETTS|nr:endo-1,4-beta-xylanase xylA, putative [Tetrahymena thermophila SB210]EAS05921.3 endo-1,4-beta-xylanase xylA, putative [Tetrahymena thermophila SB210]|eukprot:XP_001026166.3 endo-1,4-beta-xylanase xylA, putative [Tetrahymena thermophila SB210]
MNQQQLTQTFNKCIQNENDLWLNFYPFLDNVEQDVVVKVLVDNVQQTIKDQKIKAVQKYYSLQLLKSCIVNKKANKLAEYTAKKLLPTLTEIAKHNKGSNDPKRGQNVFGAGQDKDASNDFFFLLLESIKAWSLIFANIPEFQKNYNSLTKEGVIFPKEMINYQMELQELGINPSGNSSGQASYSNMQTPQQNNNQRSQQNQQQQLDPQTQEQVKKLSKFLSNIDQNLRVIDNADPQYLDFQTLEQCIGPLQKQLSKISEPLILQVLQMPQTQETENLQKKMFEVKDLLETIIKQYQKTAENPKIFPQIISNITSQISIYLQNNADSTGSQIMQQAPPLQQQQQQQFQQFQFDQQPKSASKSNFNDFNNFGQGQTSFQQNQDFAGANQYAFDNFNAAAPSFNQQNQQQKQGFDGQKDVFSEFGGFQGTDLPPQSNNTFDQFGAGFGQPTTQNKGNQDMSGFGFGFGEQPTNQFQNQQQHDDDHNVQKQQAALDPSHFGFDTQANQMQQNANMGQFGFDDHSQNQGANQQYSAQHFGFEEQKQNTINQAFSGIEPNHTDNLSRKASVFEDKSNQNTSYDQNKNNPFNDHHSQNQPYGLEQNNFGFNNQFEQQNQAAHHEGNADFFQSQPGKNQVSNTGEQDNHDTQSQKSQKNQGDPNQNAFSTQNHDMYWGGDYNNYNGNQSNQIENHEISHRQSEVHNEGQVETTQQIQHLSQTDVQNQSMSNDQHKVGYDHNDYNQQQPVHTQQSQGYNNNDYGAYGWNDHNQQNQWGDHNNNYGGDTHKNSQNFNDVNQSYNQGHNNVYNDYDHYGYNYNQNEYNPSAGQINNTQNSRRPSQTDFNQHNYSRKQSQTFSQAGGQQQLDDQKKDSQSVKDSVYNAGLTDSQYDMVLNKNNSAYLKWKQEQNFYNNPIIPDNDYQNKDFDLKPVEKNVYDPNENYDISPPPHQHEPQNASYLDINKNAVNTSMNAANNAPMKTEDLFGQDQGSQRRQPSQQSDYNWNAGAQVAGTGADTMSNQGRRKDSIQSNSQNNQNVNQNPGWNDNHGFDFFNEPAPQQKQPSNSQIPQTDFFQDNTSQQGNNSKNLNNSIHQSNNNDWGQNNFDQHYDFNYNGGQTNTNASQQKMDFHDPVGFEHQQSQHQSQSNQNQHDLFGNDFVNPSQQVVQQQPQNNVQQNNQFDFFDDNNQNTYQQQAAHPEVEQKQWFNDMKQPHVEDDFFNNVGSKQQSQHTNQSAAAAAVPATNTNFFDDFGTTPTPQQQPQQQTQVHDNQFDFGAFNNQSQPQAQPSDLSNNQAQWNQPDGYYKQYQEDPNQQKQKPPGQVDLFDMADAPNPYQQQQQQQQQNQFNQHTQQSQQQGQGEGGFDFFGLYNQNNTNQMMNMSQQQQQQQGGFGFNQQGQQLYQQFQQPRELAQPGKASNVGDILPAYQLFNKMVRDGIVQTTNEFDKARIGMKTYKILEVSPEIRKRNEEFYQQLNREEAIKGFMDEQKKELLNKKLIETDADKSSIIDKKLETLNVFQLLIIDRQDYLDPLSQLIVPKPVQTLSKSTFDPQFQSIVGAEQKENSIKEIKELNQQIIVLQNQIEQRNIDEQILTKRIDELQKDLFSSNSNVEKLRKELEGLLSDHDKILISEKEVKKENEKLLKEISILKEELIKLKEDNTKILNEAIDPEYIKKSYLNNFSPIKNGSDQIDSKLDLDPQSKKILNTVRQRYNEYHSVQISRTMREGYKVVEEKVNSSNSLEFANKVTNNLDKLLKLNYQSSPYQDDALVQMIGNKTIRQKQKEKNKIFYNTTQFKELVDLPIYQKDRENLDNFKYSCLNSKAILYENTFLQIGSITQFEENKVSRQNLTLSLHFINKTQNAVQFTFNFATNYKMLKPGCEVKDPVTIKGKSQKKHTVEAQEFDIKQSIPLVDINIVIDQGNAEARIAIPIALNKFMIFQPIDQMQFRQKWLNFKTSYIYNEPREINERFIKNLSDIKRYFECMIELNNRQRPLRSRYGVSFRINGVGQFLMKICLVNNSKLTFKIATYDQYKDVAEYLCNYLCFIFTI